MAYVTDLAVEDRATATFAPLQFGRHRYETLEGYVLWEGVRLARIGPMLYKPEDFPGYEAGANGMIVAERDEDILFHPDTMSSFNAKPMTDDHPPTMLDIDNVAEFEVGLGFNIRRGEGVDTGYLVGDLLVKDADTIELIDKGKREISLGYDCDAVQIKPGLVRITKIVGNHIALVKRGRAGPFCSIQDEENSMATPKKPGPLSKLKRALLSAFDEAAEEMGEEVRDEAGDGTQRLVIEVKGAAPEAVADEGGGGGGAEADPYEARFAAIDTALAGLSEGLGKLLAPPPAAVADAEGEKDPDAEVTDEDEDGETTKVAAMDAMSKAEILAPGIKMPKFDSAKGPAGPVNALKRQALKTAHAGKHQAVIASVVGAAPDFDKMPLALLDMAFTASAALVGAANNDVTRPRPMDIPQGAFTPSKMQALIEQRRAPKH